MSARFPPRRELGRTGFMATRLGKARGVGSVCFKTFGAGKLVEPGSAGRHGAVTRWSFLIFGAGHAVRTRDPELGKLVLYQLS